jgi:hypothetical protein
MVISASSLDDRGIAERELDLASGELDVSKREDECAKRELVLNIGEVEVVKREVECSRRELDLSSP